jgi:hypothetical protein
VLRSLETVAAGVRVSEPVRKCGDAGKFKEVFKSCEKM